MKKILLVAINARYSHTNLAIRYLKQVCEDLNYNIIIKEFSINEEQSVITETIKKENPFGVAISTYIWNSEITKNLINTIKNILPKTKIILGGPEVSYNPKNWIDSHPAIDYLITNGG